MSKKPLNISEEAAVQMPMKTVASLIIIVALGTMGYFQIVERLNIADTRIQLMEKDLEAANAFIDGVPKGDMVSPQIQEIYMLVEYLSENVDKLKEQMEAEIPMILKNDMVIQFHEERLIDLESKQNGVH